MDTLPPVSFYFQLSAEGSLASFQEVSGIATDFSEEENVVGNDFTHKIPTAGQTENLVLKRGLLLKNSPLAGLLQSMLESDLSQPVRPKSIQVSLLDAERNALKTWTFQQAYIVRWEISDSNSESNTIALETLEFAYSYFETTT